MRSTWPSTCRPTTPRSPTTFPISTSPRCRAPTARRVAFFIVNRHPDEAMTIDIDMAGFAPKAIAEHITIAHPDLKATNTAQKQDRVAPQAGKGVSRQRRRGQRQARPALLSRAARQRLSAVDDVMYQRYVSICISHRLTVSSEEAALRCIGELARSSARERHAARLASERAFRSWTGRASATSAAATTHSEPDAERNNELGGRR